MSIRVHKSGILSSSATIWKIVLLIVGTLFAIGYQDEEFYMVQMNWDAEEDWECSRDGEVKMSWNLDEGNTKINMLRVGTNNTKGMIQAKNNRFGEFRDFASNYMNNST